MAQVFAGAFGPSLTALWYHFAIMFEALFILTTVDAGTRVGRFMLQDSLGNLYKPFARTSWKPGLWSTSAVVVAAWGYFLWVGVGDPLGGINQLFPLFGIANQLLAAVALTLGTVILVKSGRVRYAWVTGVPLAWDAAVTLTASYQKVFSADPRIGFFANAERYSTAIEQGKLLAPASSGCWTAVSSPTPSPTAAPTRRPTPPRPCRHPYARSSPPWCRRPSSATCPHWPCSGALARPAYRAGSVGSPCRSEHSPG